MKALATVAVLAIAAPAGAQLEDYRTRTLMQDVAELKRVVRQQSQRIDQLERELTRLGAKLPAPETALPEQKIPQPKDAPWMTAKTWDKVAVGMTEKQVLNILGYPTGSRTDEKTAVKTLFYTVAVGTTGFLSGNVEIEKERVRAVQKPVLK
jgi:outer membrane protein assembly factor BamE (lipoprotein component of BamABCDE complex)